MSVGGGSSVDEGGVDPSVLNDDDEEQQGDKVCIACERRKTGGKPYKHGHAPFCEKSIYYGLSERQINSLKNERSNKLKDTKENVLRRMGLTAKDAELKFPEISESFPKVCDVPADLSSRHLSAIVDANENNTSKAPRAVTVILRYLQMLAPNLKKGTNQVIPHEENMLKLEYFRDIFPRGSITFTVPKEDPTLEPNPEYRIAEGCKLLLVRWELQTDNDLKCPHCKKGDLIFKKVAFSRTAIKPIIDIEGKLTWVVGSSYRCSQCDVSVQSTDPELLETLPSWMQDAYPVDHTWINKAKTFQIGRRLASLIETIFIGEGYDGHFVSYFLRKLFDNRYRADHKLLMDAFEMHGKEAPKKDEWSFEKWTGEFSFPLGDFLREAYDYALEKEGGSIGGTPGGQGKLLPLYPPPVASRHHLSSPPRHGKRGEGGSDPNTPRKRPARAQPPRQPQSLPHHQLAPMATFMPPGAPPRQTIGAVAGISPTVLSPHTPSAYHGGHAQWPPGYGPGPAFPIHYSPPPPHHYGMSPGFGYGLPPPVPSPERKPSAPPPPPLPPHQPTAAAASKQQSQHEDALSPPTPK